MANGIIGTDKKTKFDYSVPRICRKCGVLFSGRGCNDCRNASRKARRKANPEKEKISASAYREKNRETFAKRAAKYRADNPEACRETLRKSLEKNKEKNCLKRKERYLKNRDALLAKAAEYRKRTKPKKRAAAQRYRKENPEKVKAQFAAWIKANPEANRERVQNRRARKIANGGTISKGLVDRLLVLQKGKCPCCGKRLGDDYHLDHITPLVKGGANSDENMQLLRGLCNMQKHSKDPIDFMQERGFLI